jgi:Trk K+ transport system NAD-binding subunit
LIIPEMQRRLARRNWQLARAIWRNGRVIGREFRTPILVLLVAVFGGGWLYGELLIRAGYGRVPYVDLPYTMLALMMFQPPTDLPAEAHLIAFWYLMPVIALYAAGQGVFNFVNLFYRSDERHASWEEAVASTYANHVIVLGVGHLGTRVIHALTQMGFEVVAIDTKTDTAKNEDLDQQNVPLVIGDGRLASTLDKAGIRHARALIVCTSNDHMNLEVTMRARDLNPTLRIVVRVWDDQFANQISRFLNVEAVLSATDLAAPSFAGSAVGIEITQTLVIDGEEYSMIRLEVAPGSFLDGKTVGVLQDEEEMDIVLHGQHVHPSDETVVRAGDTLVIFAQHRKMTEVVARNQRRK